MRLVLLLFWVVYVASSPENHRLPCPTNCHCSTTPEGLHKAECTDFSELQKYLRTSKNHSIHILNLSHNKITKINGQLDKLTELRHLDLSYNEITHITKLLRYSKHLSHLNLSNNKLKDFSASVISRRVDSLYLANNNLTNVPEDLIHLENIEHLVLAGNPLNCSCDNLELKDSLHQRNVVLSDVECVSPKNLKGKSWLQIKTLEFCKKHELNSLDMMMGDDPFDTEIVSPESNDRKSLPLTDAKELEEGEVFEGSKNNEDDDEGAFLTVPFEKSETTTDNPESDTIDGSGQSDDFVNSKITGKSLLNDYSELANDEMIPTQIDTTEEPYEGSGDFGSGLGAIFKSDLPYSSDPSLVDDFFEGSGALETNVSTTTQSFITGMFNPFFIPGDLDNNVSEPEPFEPPKRPTLFLGKTDWENDADPGKEKVNDKSEVVEVIAQKINKPVLETEPVNKDTDVEAPTKGRILLDETLSDMEEAKQPKKTSVGTYVCVALLGFLLVGLILFTIIKGRIRKRRDRRLLRQQKRDVEHGGKELVDMNKSLLGKPAPASIETDKKMNGKYELVPTHEAPLNKNSNGNVERPVVENMAKAKSIPEVAAPPLDHGELLKKSQNADVVVPSTNGKLHPRGSLSSDEVFVPHEDEPNKSNGFKNPSLPLTLNGGDPSNSDYTSPVRDYVPVYSPDMGRVRIKITETPKPTTPVLVTRTRSNAGDIIITPTIDLRPSTKTKS